MNKYQRRYCVETAYKNMWKSEPWLIITLVLAVLAISFNVLVLFLPVPLALFLRYQALMMTSLTVMKKDPEEPL